MAKNLGILAFLAAVALLGWLLLGGEPARGLRSPSAEEAPVSAGAAASERLAPAQSGASAAREPGPPSAERTADAAAADAPAAASAPDLRVHVRDGRGQALSGLEVSAELRDRRDVEEARLVARTDERGDATFSGLRQESRSDAEQLLRVALVGLFVPTVAYECPAEPWPTQPLELVVPSAGAVELFVREASGEPHLAERRSVELRLERELAPGAMVWRESARLSAALEAGVARFAPVGLDLRLTAYLSGRAEVEPTSTTFDGPRAPGEVVRAELVLAPPAPQVRLRVLSPARAPLASTTLALALVRRMGGSSISSGDEQRTDAEGWLTLAVPGARGEGESLALVLTHRPDEGPEARATLELPGALGPGTHDLGEVVLAGRPLLVGGRVVDEDGRGVPAASLVLESRSEYDGTVYWETFAWCEVRADGRFAAYDEAPAEPLRLALDSAEHQPLEPLEFTPGTAGLELVLRRGQALRGRVRVPEGMSPLAIGVVAQGAREVERREVQVQASGEFELTGLPPGSFELEFALRPTGERVLVLPGVRVAAGENDPRLADVDLTQLVRLVRLGVRAADGAPAAGGWVRLLRADGGQQVAFVIEGGVAELLLPASGADVEVNVPGHSLLELPGLAADREVALAASFRVQLELAPHVALPPGGELQVRLVPAQAGGGSQCSLYRAHEQAGWFSTAFGNAQNSFDARRVLELEVQAPGEHEVVFHLVRGSTKGRLSVTLRSAGPNTRLALDENSAGRTFQVEPEAEDYAQQLGGK